MIVVNDSGGRMVAQSVVDRSMLGCPAASVLCSFAAANISLTDYFNTFIFRALSRLQ